MATNITTRAGKGSALTHNEVDANFSNLKTTADQVQPVSLGGTGLTSGTSGGIVGFTAAGVLACSVALTQHAILLGGGNGATPYSMASLGTNALVLHGNAAGAPSWSAVDLATDVSGNLGVAHLNGGSGATASTYWCGDGTWKAAGGGQGNGTVTNTGTLTASALMVGNGGVDSKVLASLGSTTTVLHGNAGGMPSWSAVNLATDCTGTLPMTINAQTGTSYTIQSGDEGKLVTFSNSSPIAVTLPNATGSFGNGYSVMVHNKGAGLVTITPQTCNIDGLTTGLDLPQYTSIMLVSDGTNWTSFRGRASVNTRTAQITLSIGNGVDTIQNGASSFPIPCVFAGTIKAWTIAVDAGTCTLKVWKKATGTAIPTVSDAINTNGIAISSGTLVRSTTLTDFSTNTNVTANDVFIANVTATSSGPKLITLTLEILKS